MKKFWAFIAVVFSVSSALAQQSETRSLQSFSGVKVAGGIDVFLKQGDKESAKVEVDGTDLSNVVTEVSGSYLKVHMKDVRVRSVKARVYVTYVKVDKLSASAAGSIFSEGTIQAKSMEISASSAGSIEVTIDAESAEVSSSSAGDVELRGTAKNFTADVSTAGEIDAYDLEAGQVQAEASTAGTLKVSVEKSLNAQASTGGNIRYRGNPEKSITNSSTGGSVKKSD
ncbi:MAG TPA: head GIN domain-containing protein [Chryseosolibacter sp.]|jgi:hypothetical protein|nr:head GIN domain-containing protein [Chryseosolibacter sp.]